MWRAEGTVRRRSGAWMLSWSVRETRAGELELVFDLGALEVEGEARG